VGAVIARDKREAFAQGSTATLSTSCQSSSGSCGRTLLIKQKAPRC